MAVLVVKMFINLYLILNSGWILNPYTSSLLSKVSNTLSVSVQEADGLPDINSAPSTGKLYSHTRPQRTAQPELASFKI